MGTERLEMAVNKMEKKKKNPVLYGINIIMEDIDN